MILPNPSHGHVHLHLQSIHFEHNIGGIFFDRMNHLVVIRVHNQEWISNVCRSGGKNPRW